MRLQDDQVKRAILDPDRDVREAAVNYFSRSFSQDPGIMPMAIQAIEQYGKDNAFEGYSFLKDLLQTDETVLWPIAQRKKLPGGEEYGYEYAIRSALAHADAAVLERHRAEILCLEDLSDDAKRTITERISFLSESPEELCGRSAIFADVVMPWTRFPRISILPTTSSRPWGSIPAISRPRKSWEILNATAKDKLARIVCRSTGGRIEIARSNLSPVSSRCFTTRTTGCSRKGIEPWCGLVAIKSSKSLPEPIRQEAGILPITAASVLENIHTDLSVETKSQVFRYRRGSPPPMQLASGDVDEFCHGRN